MLTSSNVLRNFYTRPDVCTAGYLVAHTLCYKVSFQPGKRLTFYREKAEWSNSLTFGVVLDTHVAGSNTVMYEHFLCFLRFEKRKKKKKLFVRE